VTEDEDVGGGLEEDGDVELHNIPPVMVIFERKYITGGLEMQVKIYIL
jgi:hypothetical protein